MHICWLFVSEHRDERGMCFYINVSQCRLLPLGMRVSVVTFREPYCREGIYMLEGKWPITESSWNFLYGDLL